VVEREAARIGILPDQHAVEIELHAARAEREGKVVPCRLRRNERPRHDRVSAQRHHQILVLNADGQAVRVAGCALREQGLGADGGIGKPRPEPELDRSVRQMELRAVGDTDIVLLSVEEVRRRLRPIRRKRRRHAGIAEEIAVGARMVGAVVGIGGRIQHRRAALRIVEVVVRDRGRGLADGHRVIARGAADDQRSVVDHDAGDRGDGRRGADATVLSTTVTVMLKTPAACRCDYRQKCLRRPPAPGKSGCPGSATSRRPSRPSRCGNRACLDRPACR
jgi:hypothetical protein